MEPQPEARLDLAGTWRFEFDPDDVGEEQAWFAAELTDTVLLPGTTATNSKGTRLDNPEAGRLARRYHYVGAAWYQKKIDIPQAWQGKRVTLSLERCHWTTKAWFDDKALGMRTSLSTPHCYELSQAAEPGSHTITLRVDNRPLVWVGGMYVMDDAQQNWNGIVGRIELEATPPVWVDSVQVYPDVARGAIRVVTGIGALATAFGDLTLELDLLEGDTVIATRQQPVTASQGPAAYEGELTLPPDFKLWDEFSPQIYRLRATLGAGSSHHEKIVSFGMRELRASSRQFQLNSQPCFLRGHVDCNIWPDTGYAPMEKSVWAELLAHSQSLWHEPHPLPQRLPAAGLLRGRR